jgi:hypothetical protein
MNKFNAKPVTIDGIRFASKKEGKRYGELKLMERAGVITDLVLQPAFKFPKLDFPREYRADFEYVKDGSIVVEDVKGIKKGNVYAMFRIKKALVKYFHKIDVVEI